MPNRIIKESICTSPTIDRLSVEAERFFYRLIVKCDDYGLYYGDERILLGACFPLRVSEIKCDQVRSWLSELETVGLIIRYQVDDRVYISFTSWADHQNIRAKRRKYPEPTPENTMPPLAGDGNCDQLMAIAPVTRISLLGSRISVFIIIGWRRWIQSRVPRLLEAVSAKNREGLGLEGLEGNQSAASVARRIGSSYRAIQSHGPMANRKRPLHTPPGYLAQSTPVGRRATDEDRRASDEREGAEDHGRLGGLHEEAWQ